MTVRGIVVSTRPEHEVPAPRRGGLGSGARHETYKRIVHVTLFVELADKMTRLQRGHVIVVEGVREPQARRVVVRVMATAAAYGTKRKWEIWNAGSRLYSRPTSQRRKSLTVGRRDGPWTDIANRVTQGDEYPGRRSRSEKIAIEASSLLYRDRPDAGYRIRRGIRDPERLKRVLKAGLAVAHG